MSWNCGAEGETDDPAVEALRSRQVRNFAAILLLAQGVPMVLAGDEVRRTQKGNNNAYCQDNEISWFDWRLLEKHGELFRFWKLMIDFRKRHPAIHRSRFFDGKVNDRGLPDVSWHGCQLLHPGWDDPNARALAFTLAGFGAGGRHPCPLEHGRRRGWTSRSRPCRGGSGTWSWTRHNRRRKTSPSRARRSRSPANGCGVEGRSVVVLLSR